MVSQAGQGNVGGARYCGRQKVLKKRQGKVSREGQGVKKWVGDEGETIS
jgi:hypothetical protein